MDMGEVKWLRGLKAFNTCRVVQIHLDWDMQLPVAVVRTVDWRERQKLLWERGGDEQHDVCEVFQCRDGAKYKKFWLLFQ